MVKLQDENGNTIYSTPNKFLQAPSNQVIREMRHHVHCKEHNGVVGYHASSAPICTSTQLTPPNASFSHYPAPFSHTQQMTSQHPLLVSSLSTLQSTPQSTQPSTLPSTLPYTLSSTQPSSLPFTLPSSLPSTLPSTIPSSLPSTISSTLPSTPEFANKYSHPSNPQTTTLSKAPYSKDLNKPISNQSTLTDKSYNVNDLVEHNNNHYLQMIAYQKPFTKAQIDRLAYMIPYHMKLNPNMRPEDCRDSSTNYQPQSLLEAALLNYCIRHPLFQLRYNIHDSEHRKSCFKNGCECRFDLPTKTQDCADIIFASENKSIWFFVD